MFGLSRILKVRKAPKKKVFIPSFGELIFVFCSILALFWMTEPKTIKEMTTFPAWDCNERIPPPKV